MRISRPGIRGCWNHGSSLVFCLHSSTLSSLPAEANLVQQQCCIELAPSALTPQSIWKNPDSLRSLFSSATRGQGADSIERLLPATLTPFSFVVSSILLSLESATSILSSLSAKPRQVSPFQAAPRVMLSSSDKSRTATGAHAVHRSSQPSLAIAETTRLSLLPYLHCPCP